MNLKSLKPNFIKLISIYTICRHQNYRKDFAKHKFRHIFGVYTKYIYIYIYIHCTCEYSVCTQCTLYTIKCIHSYDR